MLEAPSSAFAQLRTELRRNAGRFYVYLLHWPDGTPFYVGYGLAGRRPIERVLSHVAEARSRSLPTQRRNWHKIYTIRKIWAEGGEVMPVIESWHASKMAAIRREIELIARIGRAATAAGPLTNLTTGGDGAPALSGPGELLARLGRQRGGRAAAEWTRANPLLARERSIRGGLAAARTRAADRDKYGPIQRKSGLILADRINQRRQLDPDFADRVYRARANANKLKHAQQPEKYTAHGIRAYQTVLGPWIAANPSDAEKARAKGREEFKRRLEADPARRIATAARLKQVRAAWGAENPQFYSAHGKRQAARNREKAAVRQEWLVIVRTFGLSIELPSGRAGLAEWQDALRRARAET